MYKRPSVQEDVRDRRMYYGQALPARRRFCKKQATMDQTEKSEPPTHFASRFEKGLEG